MMMQLLKKYNSFDFFAAEGQIGLVVVFKIINESLLLVINGFCFVYAAICISIIQIET